MENNSSTQRQDDQTPGNVREIRDEISNVQSPDRIHAMESTSAGSSADSDDETNAHTLEAPAESPASGDVQGKTRPGADAQGRNLESGSFQSAFDDDREETDNSDEHQTVGNP